MDLERGAPRAYEFSPGVTRSFCADRGASLFYEDRRLPGEIYVAIVVFDEPERFHPEVHSCTSQKLVWLEIEDTLPREEKSSKPR